MPETTTLYPFRVRHRTQKWHIADWAHAMDFAEELSGREFHKVIVDRLTFGLYRPLGWFQAGTWYGNDN